MKTTVVPPPVPEWFIVDADGKNLGHITSRIAHVLRGKHLPTYSPHQLCGAHVIVVNAEKLTFQAAKLRRKIYYHHTGYPGSIRATPLKKMYSEHPKEVIVRAVKGMLANTRLRPRMLKRLHVFEGGEHKYAAQKPVPLTV
ncbi:MAG: 50S ribosomal protein L13 [Candidatus Peregrinibacteria bacterium]|nr:50S ribosomal protein L13 [Candidatus Peregrinibacteria bacterium]